MLPFYGEKPNQKTSDETIGEAWVLSDVDGTESIVANGALAGQSLRQLLKQYPQEILGQAKLINNRFPLLLKFIDAKQELSVQVHPNDDQANAKKPGQNGKTEAWVVLAADPQTSKMYAGFREGVSEEKFRNAMQTKTVPETMHTFTPKPGDCIFLKAGTVHAIGADTFLFEVQQTSDITYRLYDWDRVDAKTGKSRDLHIDDGLAVSNFKSGPCIPITPKKIGDWDQLVDCDYFKLAHAKVNQPIRMQHPSECRIIVCIDGQGELNGETIRQGDVLLIPASLGEYQLTPSVDLRVLQCSLV